MLPTGFSTSHVLIILAIALIVVGPKDLPVLLRRVGQFIGRMRSMAADFRTSFEDMARQSELDDLRKEVEAMRASTSQITDQANKMLESAGYEQDSMHDIYDAGGLKAGLDAEPVAEAAAPVAKPKRVRKKPVAAEPVIVEPAKPARKRKAPAKDIVT